MATASKGGNCTATGGKLRSTSEEKLETVFDEAPAEMDEMTRTFIDQVVQDKGAHVLSEINSRIRSMLDRAPSDASVQLQMRKERDGYMGLLKVQSQQRKFVGAKVDQRFSKVIDDIFSQVRSQIEEWRSGRDVFSPDPTV
jgi:predicted ATP-grasp superfamily ATP-dependent carboligase